MKTNRYGHGPVRYSSRISIWVRLGIWSLTHHCGIEASLQAIVARASSSAPKGQLQTSLGQSDRRERRPS
jgi:hypothetical protein